MSKSNLMSRNKYELRTTDNSGDAMQNSIGIIVGNAEA